MMRRLFFVLAGGLVLLAACGGSDAEEAADTTPQATSQATAEVTAEATAPATPAWSGLEADPEAALGQMVLTKEDLPPSLSWLEPVENAPEALQPIIAPQRDPMTMNGLPWRPGSSGLLSNSPWKASAFVGSDGGVWLWSFVTLPTDIDTLSAVRRVLNQANQLDVARLRLDIWGSFLKEELPLKPETVSIGGAEGLGNVRFSYSLTLRNVETAEEYQVEGYGFTRGPVFAVLMVVYQPGTLAKDNGIYLALTLDEKMRQTLQAAGLLEA
jgi:hypothetical protein